MTEPNDFPEFFAADVRDDGDVSVTAVKDVTSTTLASQNGHVVVDGGGSIQVGEVAAERNIWVAGRGGSVQGTFRSRAGWVYLWSYTCIGGRVEAKGKASITAWTDLTADIVSEDCVEAFAGSSFCGNATGRNSIDIEAQKDVSGLIKAGDQHTFADAVVRAGGDVTATVVATGTVDIAASQNIHTDVTADEGWIDLVANAAIRGNMSAGEEVSIWSGKDFAGTVMANGDADVKAGGAVHGRIVSRNDGVFVHSSVAISATVEAARDVIVEVTGDMVGSIVAGGDVSVLANNVSTGRVEAEWVVDIRSPNGSVTGALNTRRRWAERLMHETSPSKRRLDVIDAELVRFTTGGADVTRTQWLRAERELIEGISAKCNLQCVPADRVRLLLQGRQAVESKSGAPGYVVVTDAAGIEAAIIILEPFTSSSSGRARSLVGTEEASDHAQYYRTICIQSMPINGPLEAALGHFRSAEFADQYVKQTLARKPDNCPSNRGHATLQALLVPLVGAFDDFARGRGRELAFSILGPVARLAGLQPALRARRYVFAGEEFLKCAVIMATTGGGTPLSRMGEGLYPLGGPNSDDRGYIGDGLLQLMGLPPATARWLRTYFGPDPDESVTVTVGQVS